MWKFWMRRGAASRAEAGQVDKEVIAQENAIRDGLIKMSVSQRWLLLAAVIGVGWVLYLLGPVLTPFVIAAFLAYLGDPLVDRLETLKISRTFAVFTVFATLTILGLMLLLFLIPVLEQQFHTLIANLPLAIDWVQRQLLPKLLQSSLLKGAALEQDALKNAIVAHWQELAGTMTDVVKRITVSGQVVLAWVIDAVLVPVVTFYLLRDWDVLISHIRHLLPRHYEATVVRLARECDEVLAGFVRGQLMVMVALGAIYTIGLWLVGLNLAFSIGILAGTVSFVPYLGFAVGIAVAGLAAMVQFQDATYLIYIALVFATAEVLQGFVLSPWLVGERIGLHPVTVIFAVLAGGQLFGFIGVLLGLPAAAVIVVLLRHSRSLYLRSDLYTP